MDALFPYLLHLDFFGKCLLAVLAGSIIGFEREYRGKPAGVKTHVTICLGATALTFLSIHIADFISPNEYTNFDPSRIAGQVVTGIGFIGAGSILHSRQTIKGLTTAATLWLVTSIGMLIGAGFIVPAITVTFIALFFISLVTHTNKSDAAKQRYSLSVEVKKLISLDVIDQMIEKFDIFVIDKKLVKGEHIYLELDYSTSPMIQHLFLKRLFRLKGVGDIIKI
ncbi:MAG: putative Mg2+ transporter-C (MgtC) family protein [Candidatus Marinamargulisbacteria bacterium]|jgi:putative Mg2+ transporter-C (MgtC) family protein